jgi:hypothetical protein
LFLLLHRFFLGVAGLLGFTLLLELLRLFLLLHRLLLGVASLLGFTLFL